jgi:hypothetical protein
VDSFVLVMVLSGGVVVTVVVVMDAFAVMVWVPAVHFEVIVGPGMMVISTSV